MKQIIFSAKNDKGEPLLDFAIRNSEIWTVRKETRLEEGDKVRLKRSRNGKHEAEGTVSEVTKVRKWFMCQDAGFEIPEDWQDTYYDMLRPPYNSKLLTPDFIHITNIRPYGSE